jgi:hypothetical protein
LRQKNTDSEFLPLPVFYRERAVGELDSEALFWYIDFFLLFQFPSFHRHSHHIVAPRLNHSGLKIDWYLYRASAYNHL